MKKRITWLLMTLACTAWAQAQTDESGSNANREYRVTTLRDFRPTEGNQPDRSGTPNDGYEQLLKNTTPHSPQAEAIEKNANYSVDYSTGVPSISIPLYEIKVGNYTLPISINYHASGIKVQDMATPVGLGWTLNAGGVVNKQVRGTDDHLTGNSLDLEYISEAESITSEKCLLYVALTRPREKLIILTSVDNRADKSGVNGYKRYLGSLVDKIIYDKVTGRFSPITVNEGKSFADWLVSCAILNEDMTSLRADAGIPDNSDFPSLKCNAKWSYRHITEFDSTKTEETEESKTEIDTQLLEFLKQRLKPVSADVTTIVPTKVTASELSHKTVGYQFAAVKTPDFDISSDFSAAMKGTAAHNFVEYADFNVIKDEGGIQSEIERIIKDGYMTKDEAALIDNDSIRAFVDSRLFSRIINSKAVYREKEFTVNIPIDLFMQIPEGYVSNSADNETMLQGAMDCIFEEDDGLVIVDYKTDRVKTPHELIKRHAPQLRLYREAAVRIFEKPVKALYIYSFHLGQEIEVPLTDK